MLSGLPLLGNLLDYARDPSALFQRGYETHGAIFSIRLGPVRAAVLLGPEHHAFFFDQTDKVLSVGRTFQWMVPIFGNKFPLATEASDHEKLFPIYALPFQAKRMPGYVEAMVCETMEWLRSLGDEGQFELRESFGELVIRIAARAILGAEVRERLGHELSNLFSYLTWGTRSHFTRSNLSRFAGPIRGGAKRTLHEAMRHVIAERGAHPGEHRDSLQLLLDARRDYKGLLTDELIIDLLLGLVAVGQPNTTAHAMWALTLLLQHPDYLASVLDQQEAVLGSEASMDLPALRKLRFLDWALKEAERLRPGVVVMGRYNLKGYERGGYYIPQGWRTFISPAASHRLSAVFSKPDIYDPERFSPKRAEHRKKPFSVIGFGGGGRHCLGEHFALMEIKVILSLLLQRYTLELLDPNPRPTAGPEIKFPQSPVRIRYRRR